jgi:hypothetical protein
LRIDYISFIKIYGKIYGCRPHHAKSDVAIALLLAITISARQPRKQRSPAEMNVAAKPAWLARAAPAAPVAAVPSPVDVE